MADNRSGGGAGDGRTRWPEGWAREGGDRSAAGRGSDPDETQAMPAPGRDDGPEATRVLPGLAGGARPPRRTRPEPGTLATLLEPRPEPHPEPAAPAGPPAPPRRRRSWPLRALRGLLVLLLLLALLAAGFLFWVDSHLRKVDALGDYRGRPAATPGQDWLLVGSDSREGLTPAQRKKFRTGTAEGRRTDTMMLLHVPRHGTPTLVALPRDSYLPIPGHDRNKLNAAYSFGGPALLSRTVEQATGIRLDHYVEIGFDGFVGLVDAVGGVELCPRKAIKDKKAGLDIPAGCQDLAGGQALGYVRARSFDGRGDLGRIERQQEFLRALFAQSAKPATVLNPARDWRLANAGLDALAVDRDTGPIDLARFGLAMRKVAGDDAVVTTVPIADQDFRPGGVGSAVKWDKQDAERLFDLLRRDRPVPAADLPRGKTVG